MSIGLASAGGVASCGDSEPERLPAIGQVVLEVDTDAPVPNAVNRVRIDIFGIDGKWIDSRDVVRVNTVDWPLSFALKAQNERDTRDVIVRVRAYPEGRVRDYRGERYAEPSTFVEPKISHTLSELCDAPPPIPPGRFTTRVGARTITGAIQQDVDTTNDAGANDCAEYTEGGSSAFKLDITTGDRYRFDVVNLNPYSTSVDPILLIRKTCTDPLSQVTCADDTNAGRAKELVNATSARWPSLDAYLSPGSYTFFVSSGLSYAADVTVQWGRAADFQRTLDIVDAGVGDPAAAQPRLVVDNVDRTPAEEPLPPTTIDRLVRLQIKPDFAAKARVTLRTSCMGTQAKMVSPIEQSQGCVDTEKVLAPLAVEPVVPNDGALGRSVVNSALPNEPCNPDDGTSNVACIPGGAFLFGALDTPVSGPYATTPERFALMHRFWLDKDELSVARYREVLAKGFKPFDSTPKENNGPLDKGFEDKLNSHCVWTVKPLTGTEAREAHALNCVSWEMARGVCQFLGGDLPSEAQWEYAATAAGRPFETKWPWGGDDFVVPDCERAVTARSDPADPEIFQYGNLYSQCFSRGYGAGPLKTDVGPNGDLTSLGLRNIGGHYSEWVLDAFESYDSPCWQSSSLYDPMCWQVEPPLRSMRGSPWSLPLLPPVRRSSFQATGYLTDTGMRCAYRSKPAVLP